ncbi:diaminopimelate decarboxylase [Candidatus Woesearchaeota archaeon]|nr:diaminopimelate decarboxylase [Candidatus Woesearchaeota archaeon]
MDVAGNRLMVGGVCASSLVREYGSPLYAYDEGVIRMRFRELRDSIPFSKLRIYYACKANTNPHIMRVLREEGAFVDVLSPGEVFLAEKAGFTPDRMMFTSTGVTDDEMRFMIGKGIHVNCDSLSQLDRYGSLNRGGRVSVRINPDVGGGHHGHVITGGPDSKFGIYFDKVDEIKEIVGKHDLKLVGLHHHIGSGILEPEKFVMAMNVLLDVAKKFDNLEFVDFGGGIGIPYKPGQERIGLKELGSMIAETFTAFCRRYGKELMLFIEPGRYMVAESGFLLCTVNTVKETPKHRFVGVDTGFNHLVRPAMYGSYHEIVVADRVDSAGKEKVVVAGNICESGDVFTRDEHGPVDRELPKLREGDVLAILNTGAYGFSMSSNYNSRPRPAEVLVEDGKARVIRKREDLNYLGYGY